MQLVAGELHNACHLAGCTELDCRRVRRARRFVQPQLVQQLKEGACILEPLARPAQRRLCMESCHGTWHGTILVGRIARGYGAGRIVEDGEKCRQCFYKTGVSSITGSHCEWGARMARTGKRCSAEATALRGSGSEPAAPRCQPARGSSKPLLPNSICTVGTSCGGRERGAGRGWRARVGWRQHHGHTGLDPGAAMPLGCPGQGLPSPSPSRGAAQACSA